MTLTNLLHWTGVSWQAAHFAIGGVFSIAMWVLLARYWGGPVFGEFNYLYAYAAFWGIVFDFGLDVIITRLVAAGRRHVPGELARIKIFVVAAGVLVALALALALAHGGLGVVTTLLIGVVLFSCTNFVNGYLRGIERLDIEAKIGLMQKVLFIGAALAGVTTGAGMLWVAIAYAGSQAAALALTVFFGLKKGFEIRSDSMERLGPRLVEALWLWGVSLLVFLALRLDLFLLRHLADEAAVGIYSAGFRIVEGFTLLGLAFMNAFFPRLARAHAGRQGMTPLVKRGAVLLFAGGAAFALANWLLAPLVVNVMFGSGFEDSLPVLRYLGCVLPLAYLNMLLGQAFMAMARPGFYLTALALAMFVSVIVDVVAIPEFGSLGAVYGFTAREAFLFLILILAWKRFGGKAETGT